MSLVREVESALSRPLANSEEPGFIHLSLGQHANSAGCVKTLFDAESDTLLGIQIAGSDAPEPIHGFTLAATLEPSEA